MDESRSYDVAIVGAGPSGSFLAYLLAKQGQRVVVIDREPFPRDKVCGGGLSRKTLLLLAGEFDISPVVRRWITGAYLGYRNADVVETTLKERGGASVLRRDFDDFILQQALSKGATFVPRCAFVNAEEARDVVTVQTSRGTLRAHVLVGADGVFSEVRRRMFGTGLVRYAPSLEALVYVPGKELERYDGRVLFDFGGMPNGYGWIFPKHDHLNVGVFSIFGTARKGMRGHLARFMGCYPSLSAYSRIVYRGFCIPLRNTKGVFERGHVWLVGDAAGFAESVYGEGIYFALKSAVVAARALAPGHAGGPARPYHAELARSRMLSELWYSGLNARLIFTFPRFGFYHMVRNEAVNRRFAELIAGGVGHRECFVKSSLTAPFWILHRTRVPGCSTLSL